MGTVQERGNLVEGDQFPGPVGDLALQLTAARLHIPELQPDAASHDTCQSQAHQAGEPPGLPEGRCDGDMDRRALLVPDAAVVGGFDAEGIGSRLEVGIIGMVACSGLDPIGIQAFHFVGVLVFGRSVVVQGSEIEGKVIFPVGQPDLLIRKQVVTQWLVLEVERSDDHRRRIGVALDLVREKCVDPFAAAEEHFTLLVSEAG